MRRAVVPFDRHTQGAFVAMLARLAPHESRRFAANHLGVDLCETWVHVGWCCRVKNHAGGCLTIPAGYNPRPVTA